MKDKTVMPVTEGQKFNSAKKLYCRPDLRIYGQIRRLTNNVTAVSGEGVSGMGMVSGSDRHIKEYFVCIGHHPLGIGLYLFDYKPEFRATWGHGRQFGVMADEVEQVMPEAVSVHPDGYKMVDYAMLGISRNLH